MNKGILPFAMLAVLSGFGGAFLAVRLNVAPVRSPIVAQKTSGMLPASGITAGRSAFRAEPRPQPPEVSGDDHARRDVTEVFPDSVPPSGDWRNQHPVTLKIAPYPQATVTFQQVRTKEEGRHLTWIGRDPALPGATYVGIATPDGYDAILIVPGAGQYNFHVRDGQVLVEEVTATGRDCEVGPPMIAAVSLPVPPGVHYAETGGPAAADHTIVVTESGAVEASLTVDVLFLYNTRALAVAMQRSGDPIGYMDGYTRAGLETCNLVLQNSRVDAFAWRYVGLVAVPEEYPEKQTVTEDLRMIAPGGQFDSFVRTVRSQYGADQVLMWTGAGTRQGSAYAGDVRSEAVEPEYTVAALRLTAGILILGHELAHNFGCHHDRGHAGTGDGGTSTPDGDGLWCYGLLWNDPVGSSTSGTVMAYADFLVPYFSNPGITLDVTSTMQNRPGAFLNLGTHTIGFPETDPRAANNARILREHAAYMAAVSEEKETAPVILQQPKDASLTAGQVMTLTVSATGGGLAYQWLKDGTAIAGATETTLGKTFAATDSGSYSVRITNRQGTVTSRDANVSLIAVAAPVAAPAPTAQPSTGAKGGGGAPSIWFHLLLLTAALRRLRGRGRG